MIKKEKRYPIAKLLTFGIMPSFLKIIIYRLKGYKIGKNVKIGLGSLISSKEVFINDNSRISFGVIIKVNKLIMGRNVRINSGTFIDTLEVQLGDDSIIGEMVGIGGIRTSQSLLKIGKRCHIFSYSLINPTLPIILGDDSSFGYANYVFTHASWNSVLDGFPVVFAPITIGKGVWLPSRVQIFPNVTIGDGAVIGAGSVVTKNIPAKSFAVGSPAKVKVENYPPPITDNQKKSIFLGILKDFKKHLEFNGISISQNQDENLYNIKGCNRNSPFELVVYLDDKINYSQFENDSLVIFNLTNDYDTFPKYVNKKTMYLDIYKKQRFGKSDVGEEFTKFVSRYGLRFARLE